MQIFAMNRVKTTQIKSSERVNKKEEEALKKERTERVRADENRKL